MKVKSSAISLVSITLLYLAALIWVDSTKNIFEKLPTLLTVFPLLAGLSLSSYLLRFFRWHWLLHRAGHSIPFRPGLLTYISGFAFTATPGKIGELIRLRYLKPLGVPHEQVVSAFVFERTFDLIIVLLIASMAAARFEIFPIVAAFVALVITVVVLLASNPQWIRLIATYLRLYHLRRLSMISKMLGEGLVGTKTWKNPLDISISLVLGLFAWGLISVAFILLLKHLHVAIPLSAAIAIYPISMLAGAASILPGGIGSTEAAIVAMLSLFNIPIDMAMLVAIGIRIVTLWFAIFCGLASMLLIERKIGW